MTDVVFVKREVVILVAVPVPSGLFKLWTCVLQLTWLRIELLYLHRIGCCWQSLLFFLCYASSFQYLSQPLNDEKNSDIIALQESTLKPSINFQIHGKISYRLYRGTRNIGELIIAVRSTLSSRRLDLPVTSIYNATLVVEIIFLSRYIQQHLFP